MSCTNSMGGSLVWSPLSIVVFVLATAAAVSAAPPVNITATAASTVNVTADELYWANRAEVASSRNRAAYSSDPVAVTDKFNSHITNATRRSLMRRCGERRTLPYWSLRPCPCVATNPIDRCWRCRANWAKDRKRLARCAMGFGHKATGGLAGKIYTVTDPSDDHLWIPKKGTLRHAVIQNRPLWIVFERDMVITLTQELIMTSDKTIDGRGAHVHIVGAQLTLQSVSNVIIHNVKIHNSLPHSGGVIRDAKFHLGFRTESDGDGISVMGSSDIWIDHVSMWECSDGLIDAVDGSTAITVSNSHFTHHDHVLLFGASDSAAKDKIMQVTLAFNHFGKGLIQRMPRCRQGFFHVVNNDYTHWLMYAIGGSQNPTIISNGNRFRANDDPKTKEVTKRLYASEEESRDWVWKSQDDVFVNGAFFTQSGGENQRRFNGIEYIQARNGRFVNQITKWAGTLDCHIGKKC